MSRSIPPEDLQLLIAGYVLNDLDAEEVALIEELLSDPETAQSIEQIQRTLEQVYAPIEVQPAPHVREAVMRAFQVTLETNSLETLPIQANSTSPRFSNATLSTAASPVRLLPRWAKALGAAAAVLIIALGTSNYMLWRSLQAQQQQQRRPESSESSVVLRPTQGLETPAEAVVTINSATLQGTLTTQNLPPLEPGKVYVLWTVLNPNAPFTTDTKNAILTQVFTTSPAGNPTQAIVLPRAFQDPSVVKAIAITIEDAAAPQQHRSSPILIQQL